MTAPHHPRRFLLRNWPLLALFLAAGAVVLWLLVRMTVAAIYFHDPANADPDLKPWMTPRYIVRGYDLPPPLVAEVLGIVEQDRRGRPLGEIAAELGLTMEDLTARVRSAAAEHRAAQQ